MNTLQRETKLATFSFVFSDLVKWLASSNSFLLVKIDKANQLDLDVYLCDVYLIHQDDIEHVCMCT